MTNSWFFAFFVTFHFLHVHSYIFMVNYTHFIGCSMYLDG